SAGRGQRRPAAQRAALRETTRHHEGQEEAAGHGHTRGSWRRIRGRLQNRSRRAAPSAAEGHHGQGRWRAGCRPQEEGIGLMSTVLVVAEHMGGKLNPSTAKCVACAATISGAEIDVVVFAADGAGVAQEAAGLSGVRTVLRVDNPANAEPIAAVLAPQIAKLAPNYTHVFGPSTTFGKDL